MAKSNRLKPQDIVKSRYCGFPANPKRRRPSSERRLPPSRYLQVALVR